MPAHRPEAGCNMRLLFLLPLWPIDLSQAAAGSNLPLVFGCPIEKRIFVVRRIVLCANASQESSQIAVKIFGSCQGTFCRLQPRLFRKCRLHRQGQHDFRALCFLRNVQKQGKSSASTNFSTLPQRYCLCLEQTPGLRLVLQWQAHLERQLHGPPSRPQGARVFRYRCI